MIVSFANKETEKIWQGIGSRKLPPDILTVYTQVDKSLNLIDFSPLTPNLGEKRGKSSPILGVCL